MPDTLHLLVCSIYRLEAEAVKQTHGWADVALHTHVPACLLPGYAQQVEETLARLQAEHASVAVVGSCPLIRPQPASQAEGVEPARMAVEQRFPQCFYSLANRGLVDHFVSEGGYVLTPTWLEHWKQHLRLWGFDQATARLFFQETIQQIVLLDTGVGTQNEQNLAELGEYLSLPGERVTVGLDFFDLHLSQVVERWRSAWLEQKNKSEMGELKRRLANYATMLDLLPVLSQKFLEAAVIDQIIDIVQMLFSPNSIHYLQIIENRIVPYTQSKPNSEGYDHFLSWTLEDSDDYAWNLDNTGFYLRFANQQQTVGVLAVADLIFPQYIHQYLNLSLSMASVCGLAIANARMVQRLHDAEQMTRHEKEVSATLSQVMLELSSRFEQDEVLRRILLSLYRVIPFSDAAIFFLRGSHLDFQIGMAHLPEAEIVPYQPGVRSLEVDLAVFSSPSQVLTNVKEIPNLLLLLGKQEIASWMGIPLIAHGKLFGLLSVVSPDTTAYGRHEITLAHSFASAIESAHVFNEATILAATDSLTGIYNRRSFFELALKEFQDSLFYHRSLAVVMLDVDRFKRVNDTYGHDTGDLVLVNIAKICAQKIRSEDILGRYGGEEFVLILPNTDTVHAEIIAERLRAEIGEMRVTTEKGVVQVKASLGVACMDEACLSLEQLLKRSDQALYSAKQQGRNRVVTWQAG